MSDEIIQRVVRLEEPHEGTVVVEINLTKLRAWVEKEMVNTLAVRAYRNSFGKTESLVAISLPGKAILSEDTKQVKKSFFALNRDLNRETVRVKLEKPSE